MNPYSPPPEPSRDHDFASEHAEPASRPITPSPTSPLEGFDADHAGWGTRKSPEPWEQFKAWLRRVTRPSP